MIAANFSGHITASISESFSANFARDITTKLIFTAQLPRVLKQLLPRTCNNYCREFAVNFAAIILLIYCEFTAE
jgi:hypothetical protein